jgi:DMSO/TMAO reductase YedYZ molybdopterin-dependent catalytic subunit
VTTVDRRKFLRAAGVTAVGAAAAGVGGELLLGKHPSTNAAAQMPAAPGQAQATGQASQASTTPPPKLEIEPMKPLPPGAELNIAGVSPFYTPNKEFYRVDTSLVLPKVPAASWKLRIHGMVDRPVTLTYEDLLRLPMINRDITLTCVSDAVGGNFIGNARWQGTLLAPILRKAGIRRGADQIVMRDPRGMTIGVATDPTLDGRDSLLAVAMNGEVLPQAHGYPVRAVIPGLYGYVSATKWVVDMELTTFGAFSAYWVRQTPAWSQQAPIKTESRIDVPKRRSTVAAGRVTIAGVAWAQHQGIEAVEVGIDGVFHEAKLPAQDTIDTWRQWYHVWDATPGQHMLQVRATNKSGYTQTAIKHRTEPDGATGYHTILVNVT